MKSYHFMLQWVNCAKCRALWDIINRLNGPVGLGIRHIATESKFACLRNYGVKNVKIWIYFSYILLQFPTANVFRSSCRFVVDVSVRLQLLEAYRQSDIFMG